MLLFCDSFDHYLQADLWKKWDIPSGTLGTHIQLIQDLTSPGGGNVLNWPQSGGTTAMLSHQLPSTYATMIGGVWIMITQLSQTGAPGVLGFGDAGATQIQCCWGYDARGRIIVMRGGTGGTVLATSTNTLQPNVWYHVEFKATIHNTAGVIEVRVNGSSTGWVPSTGSLNTRNGSNNFGSSLTFHTQTNTQTHRIKSPYVLDTSGTIANDFVGPCRIALCRPGANGTNSGFVGVGGSTYGAIDEQYFDNDYTYAMATAQNTVDTYSTDDIPSAINATVLGAQYVIACRQEPGATRSIAGVSRVGNTDYVGTTMTVPQSWYFLCSPVNLNPATSAQWSVAAFNAAEFGFKVVT